MGRTQSTEKVREDFDRIADLSQQEGWDNNAHYHPFLFRQLPPRLNEALEVGCGTGASMHQRWPFDTTLIPPGAWS